MKETDYAYIAGLIDGDGYVYLYRSTKQNQHKGQWQRGIRVVGVFSDGLARAAADLGGKVYRSSRGRHGWKDLYVISWTGKRAYDLAVRSLPYFRIKQKQIQTLIEFHETYNNHFCRQNPIVPAVAQQRELLWKAMHALNGSVGGDSSITWKLLESKINPVAISELRE